MLLKLKDVAKELQCTYETARFMIERGDIPSIHLTERNIRIHPDDLQAYILNKQNEARTCKQLKTKNLDAIKSDSVIQMAISNNSLRKRISQKALRSSKHNK